METSFILAMGFAIILPLGLPIIVVIILPFILVMRLSIIFSMGSPLQCFTMCYYSHIIKTFNITFPYHFRLCESSLYFPECIINLTLTISKLTPRSRWRGGGGQNVRKPIDLVWLSISRINNFGLLCATFEKQRRLKVMTQTSIKRRTHNFRGFVSALQYPVISKDKYQTGQWHAIPPE